MPSLNDRGRPTLSGAALRRALHEEWVEAFVATHPGGTVVALGPAPRRWERAGDGRVHFHWVMAPLTSDAWVAAVQLSPPPYFFVVESALLYLNPVEVDAALHLISREFPGARIALDTACRRVVQKQGERAPHDRPAGRMKWTCEDPHEIERWGLHLRLLESRTLADVPKALRHRVPWVLRTLGPLALRKRRGGYRLNLFEIEKEKSPE